LGFIQSLLHKPMYSIYAPVAGSCVPLSQVPDPAFARQMLGKGVAIIPSEGKVYAPCDAMVDVAFSSGHAVTLTTDFGAEILIHVGTETARLAGQYFTIHVRSGARVSKGDLLIEFELDALTGAGFDVITPVLICNPGSYGTLKISSAKTVSNENVVIELAK